MHNLKWTFFLTQRISFSTLSIFRTALLFAQVKNFFELNRTIVFLSEIVSILERTFSNPRVIENLNQLKSTSEAVIR